MTQMDQEHQERLENRWPLWFPLGGGPQSPNMAFGFECGVGWYNLIWHLCEDIERFVPDDFVVFQVKQKFGELRFYFSSHVSDQVNKIVSQAEQRSKTICEDCGERGKLTNQSGWTKTQCNNCYQKSMTSPLTP